VNSIVLQTIPILAVVGAINAEGLRLAAIQVLFLIASVTFHEFAHAWTADRLGDPTPDAQGRLTLNPVAHADPVGTLGLPLLMAIALPGSLIGWGRPVETDPRRFRRRFTIRGGMALVAFAGPLSNLLLALLTLLVVWALGMAGVLQAPLGRWSPFAMFFLLNLTLFAFNLLPIHPLDGGKIVTWLLGPKYAHVDEFLTQWGWPILLGLVLVESFLDIPTLSYLFLPVYSMGIYLLQAAV